MIMIIFSIIIISINLTANIRLCCHFIDIIFADILTFSIAVIGIHSGKGMERMVWNNFPKWSEKDTHITFMQSTRWVSSYSVNSILVWTGHFIVLGTTLPDKEIAVLLLCLRPANGKRRYFALRLPQPSASSGLSPAGSILDYKVPKPASLNLYYICLL